MLGAYIANNFIGRLVGIMLIATASACVQLSHEELPSTSPYAALIGAEYRVIGDVIAHGIYANLNQRVAPSYLTLVPGVGFSGPEVAFKKPVPKGQHLTIVSAWRLHLLGFTRDVYYVVVLPGSNLPADVPIHVKLSRGNEGVDTGLNPAVYEKLAK